MKYLNVNLLTCIATLCLWPSLLADFSVQSLISVYDGDTIRVDLADDLPEIFGTNIGIRILGIDTPEVRGSSDLEKKAAYKVRDFVRELLDGASLTLVKEKRGKYFRVVADVIIDDDLSLSDILLALKYAKPYDGGKKQPWTESELEYILEN